MADEPTPWEDINPTTALARQPEQRSLSSALLKPATNEEFRNELTACLALVVPVGMTEEAKRDWLAVAWATLSHLPADLLRIGCKKARETCDHPSKIVPTIIAETKDLLRSRRESCAPPEPNVRRLPRPDLCTPEEAAEILVQYGLKRNPLDGAEA